MTSSVRQFFYFLCFCNFSEEVWYDEEGMEVSICFFYVRSVVHTFKSCDFVIRELINNTPY